MFGRRIGRDSTVIFEILPSVEPRISDLSDFWTSGSGPRHSRGLPCAWSAQFEPRQIGTRAFHAAAKELLSGQLLDMATWMRRAETLTRAPILSNRRRSVVGQALESGVSARARPQMAGGPHSGRKRIRACASTPVHSPSWRASFLVPAATGISF